MWIATGVEIEIVAAAAAAQEGMSGVIRSDRMPAAPQVAAAPTQVTPRRTRAGTARRRRPTSPSRLRAGAPGSAPKHQTVRVDAERLDCSCT